MIGTVLQFVTRQINLDICRRLQVDPGQRKMVLASHVSPDGTFGGAEENVLLLCLAGVRRDAVAKRMPGVPDARVPVAGGPPGPAYVNRQPPVHLNLQLIIAANFRGEQMPAGLDMLSMAILMLQAHPVWDALRFPDMPEGVGDLAFEMETLSYQEQSHLWGAIGAKYMPSVVYKMRMLTLEDLSVESVVPGVRTVDNRRVSG